MTKRQKKLACYIVRDGLLGILFATIMLMALDESTWFSVMTKFYVSLGLMALALIAMIIDILLKDKELT
jgi:predicted membrane channel-forming protein YqfA (hemolysin III family)